MPYFFLILTILLESGAVICMKLSDGFHNKLWAVTAVVLYVLSFLFLTLSLKTLQAGITNAIWAGSSTVLVAVLGIFIFKENINFLQLIFILMIVIGIVGISLSRQTG